MRCGSLLDGGLLVVTHGNGPQVGVELLRAPATPLHVAVARTQAEIGSALAAELGAACLVTQATGGEVTITSAESLEDALAGRAGTRVTTSQRSDRTDRAAAANER